MTPLDAASIAGNVITSGALAIAGIAALSMAVASRDATRALPSPLASIIGASLLFLAADEGFDLHERIGRWLYEDRGVEAPGPINHADDLIILVYMVVAGIVGLLALPSLVRARAFFASMIAVGTMFVFAAALDTLGTPGSWTDVPEEALEACGAVALAIIFVREAGLMASRPSSIAVARTASPAAD
jgi:hypothetical protein